MTAIYRDAADSPLARIVATGGGAQSFVTRVLQALEAEHRALALLALADWQRTGLVEPALFPVLGALQRPSWGTWNFLVQTLRRARKAQLRAGGTPVRDALERATDLTAVLALTDAGAPAELVAAARPLASYLEVADKLRRVGDVMALPIALRNRVAHFPPADDAGWEDLRAALTPLAEYRAARPFGPLAGPRTWPAPWFEMIDDEPWALGGVERDFAVVYISATATRPRTVTERAGDFVRAVQGMLGRNDLQEATFHRLLARLAPEELRGVVLGDFLVGPPVAQGGFAVVHVGRQLSTGRKVALKLLHDGLDEDARLRFRQEAAFLSRLDHPSIVGVLSHGEDAWSVPRYVDLAGEAWFEAFARGAAIKTYIALEWIDGETLEQLYQSVHVAHTRARPAIATIAGWFRDAARALEAVHAAGLVHRDIKPSNLMVAGDGTIRIMDFGVARSDEETRTLQTVSRTAIGTPPYMSPEQIRAHDADAEVGPRTDVYSLCATFYELVSGARLYAHDRESADTVRNHKLRGELPARPRTLVEKLPWELDVILLGGLEPELVDRYPSAAALARDLEHWERDEPLEYRRPGLVRRATLAYRRNRAVANIVLAFVVLAAAGSTLYLRNIQDARDRAEDQSIRAKAEAARADAQRRDATARLVDLYTEQGRQELLAGSPRRASRFLAEAYASAEAPSATLRFLLARALALLPIAEVRGGDITLLSDDGTQLIVGRGKTLEAIDVATGTSLHQVAYPASVQDQAWLAPDGRVVTATQVGTSLVDLASGAVVTIAQGLNDPMYDDQPVVTPDGARIVMRVFRPSEAARVSDAHTGATLFDIRRENISRVAFDREGARVSILLDEFEKPHVETFDARTARPVAPLVAGALELPHVSADGHRAAAATRAGVSIVDAATGKLVSRIDHAARVLALGPDGTRLVVIDTARETVELWNAGGQTLATLSPASTCSYRCGIAFDPTGGMLAMSIDGDTKLWNAATGAPLATLDRASGHLRFSRDGARLAAGSVVWDLSAIRPLALDRHVGNGESLAALDPAGQRVATVTQDADGRGRVRDAKTGALVATLAWEPGPSRGKDGGVDAYPELVVTGLGAARVVAWTTCCFGNRTAGGDAHTYDATTGKVLESWDSAGFVTPSPSGTRLAMAVGEQLVIDGLAPLQLGEIRAIAWSADARQLAAVTSDEEVVIDAATSAIAKRFKAHGIGSVLRFSPDGTKLLDEEGLTDIATGKRDDFPGWGASFSRDGKLVVSERGIHEAFGRRVVCTLDGGTLAASAFSPDGQLVAIATRDIGVYDAHTCKPLGTLAGTVEVIGDQLVSARDDGTLGPWQPPLEERTPEEVTRLVAARSGWSLDGGVLVRADSP